MALSNLLALFTKKMDYLMQRQGVIADNVANANTPNFKAREMASFESVLGNLQSGRTATLTATNPMHFTTAKGVGGGLYKASASKDVYEVKPSGNSVVTEQQLADLAETNSQYQMITGLYKKTMGLIKTAMGRAGG